MYIYIYTHIYYYILPVCKKFCFNSGLFRTIISDLHVSASRVLIHFLQTLVIRLNIFYEYLTGNHATY